MIPGRLVSRGSALVHPAGLSGRSLAGVGLAVAAALGGALALGGATLLLRRLAGGFAVVPGPSVAWAVAAAGGGLATATAVAAHLAGDRWPRWLAGGGLAAAAVAVAPIGAGLAWHERLAAAAAVAVALVTAIAAPLTRPRVARSWPRWRGRPALPPIPEPSGSPRPDTPRPEPEAARLLAPAGIRQRLERLETAAGEDRLHGLVMVAVPAGSRSGVAHVGFCPSFRGLPLVEVSTACDVVEAAVLAAEILPWGVRIECRLSEPAEEPLEIPVDVVARRPT